MERLSISAPGNAGVRAVRDVGHTEPLPTTSIPARPLPSGPIPKRFVAATFDNYRSETASQTAAMKAVRWWLDEVKAGRGPMLALVGKQGTGKSHLLYAAARTLLATRPPDPKDVMLSGWRAPFVGRWYDLADELRYSDNSQAVRSKMRGAPVVLMDEVRPTSGTNFDDTELAKFACHAYDEMVPVLVTSNVSPLSEVMGDAAASRFTQITIMGRDARQERAA